MHQVHDAAREPTAGTVYMKKANGKTKAFPVIKIGGRKKKQNKRPSQQTYQEDLF